jgi:hypothetical protein
VFPCEILIIFGAIGHHAFSFGSGSGYGSEELGPKALTYKVNQGNKIMNTYGITLPGIFRRTGAAFGLACLLVTYAGDAQRGREGQDN